MPLFAIGPRERGSELITRPLYDGIADIWVSITARRRPDEESGAKFAVSNFFCEAVVPMFTADQLCRM